MGLTASLSGFAQGRIYLESYGSTLNSTISFSYQSTYYPVTGYTVGFYWAPGVWNVSDPTDPGKGGDASISTFAPSFVLATGTGSTATTLDGYIRGGGVDYVFAGVISGPVSLLVVAYNGASYDTSTIRGHSPCFQMTPGQFGVAPQVGDYMPSFIVGYPESFPSPEPSTFALTGLGLVSLLAFRRRK